MIPEWLSNLGIALVAASSGWLVSKAARRSTDHARIRALESRVDGTEARNRRLWFYTRQLIDHIYRGHPAPPPPPPEDLFEGENP